MPLPHSRAEVPRRRCHCHSMCPVMQWSLSCNVRCHAMFAVMRCALSCQLNEIGVVVIPQILIAVGQDEHPLWAERMNGTWIMAHEDNRTLV